MRDGLFFKWPLMRYRRFSMNATYVIIAVVAIVVVMGLIMGPGFARRQHSKQLQGKFGAEYDHTLEVEGGEKKAHAELDKRQKHVDQLNIRSLSAKERDRYTADWSSVQSKFVDEPGQAIVNADRLIMEVMQVRAYPLSDFEQRAADVSVSYPALVGNYRAAKAIALKNEKGQASTEELRQALIYYRSLFDELLETNTANAKETIQANG
jgi:hypothetical protein